MKLHFREYGTYSEIRPTLILLHGLLGSSGNWHGIARRLAPNYHVIAPDLRNHGSSPHADRVDYPAMSEDLMELMDEHGLDSALLIGHSMGGKIAMWLSLQQPERIEGLVVADIAPVRYKHRFDTIFRALRSIDLGNLRNRGEADASLAAILNDPGLRQYLLQNLARSSEGWQWRINRDALEAGMEEIIDFPQLAPGTEYPGPALFIYGTASDYVRAEYQPQIHALFPYARLRAVPGADHWLYSEQPEAFLSGLRRFLDDCC